MVQNSGKTLRAGTFKPVNIPEPVQVEESGSGEPLVVKTTRRQAIISVEDRWRIDEEWWRSEPISRLYYAVLLASGQRLMIYKDLINNRWHKQGY